MLFVASLFHRDPRTVDKKDSVPFRQGPSKSNGWGGGGGGSSSGGGGGGPSSGGGGGGRIRPGSNVRGLNRYRGVASSRIPMMGGG